VRESVDTCYWPLLLLQVVHYQVKKFDSNIPSCT
ncbi:hypothetical protein AVEN_117323-1, partial [Araneus ventricosus]